METQTATLSEIILLTLFYGSIVFLLGAAYQVFALVKFNKKSSWYKVLGIVLFTRGAVIALSIFIWKIAFQNTEIMFGPILLPGIIAEIILSPLILKLFGFRVIKKG
nr:hypothetical protein [uncultured Draconibacterium sp.]